MKKQVKRAFSALLVLSMLLCCGVTFVTAPVSAQETDVVFELDMSSLTDKSSNSIALTELGTVVKNSFTNQAGAKVNYITTGSGSGNLRSSSEAGILKITDDKITKLDNYTVEAWVKYETPASTRDYPKFFKQVNSSGVQMFAYEMPSATNAKKMVCLDKEAITYDDVIGNLADQWKHYVLTFETVKNGEANVTAVNPRLYIDGVNATGNYTDQPTVTEATKLANVGTGTIFTIGGQSDTGGNFNMGFPGSIASFKIYNTVKSQDEAKALYEAQKDGYVQGLEVDEGGVILDVDPVTLKDVSGNEIALTKLGTVTNGSYTNGAGETVSYMRTGSDSQSLQSSSAAGSLLIMDSNVTTLTNYTIEAWMKYDDPVSSTNNQKWPKMFSHKNGTTDLMKWEMPASSTYSSLDAVILGSSKKIQNVVDQAGVSGQWKHWVVTYETIKDGEGNATAVNPRAYLDGESLTKEFTTQPTQTDSTYLAAVGGGTEFVIGGNSNGSGGFGVGFPGDFASFKIYKGVKTATEVKALYDAQKDTYGTVWSAEGVRPSAGCIEVALGKEIREASLSGNVKLEKVVKSGEEETVTPAKGGAYASVSESNSAKAAVKFGMLEDNTTYRITFDKAIAFTDGTALGTDKTIEFTTGSSVLIDTDFDDYTTANLTKDGLRFRSKGTWDSTDGVSVEEVTLESGATDKVLRFTADTINSPYYIWLELDEAVAKDEVLKIEEKARSYSSKDGKYGDVYSNNTRMMRFKGLNSSNAETEMPTNAGIVYFSWPNVQGDDDFIEVMSNVLWSEDTQTFNATRLNGRGEEAYEPTNLTLKNITALCPVQLYLTNADYVNSYVELSKYKVTRGIAPAIMNVAYDGNRTITVVFNDDMTKVNKDTLEVVQHISADSDVTVEGTQVAYNADTRTATITLFEPLAEGSYLINAVDVVSPTAGEWNGYSELAAPASTAFSRTVEFKAGGTAITEGSAIPAGTTELSAAVSFNNIEDKSVVIFAALYNNNNELVKASEIKTVNADSSEADRTLTIDGVTTADGYKMKVFVWDSMNAITPVFTVKSIGK